MTLGLGERVLLLLVLHSAAAHSLSEITVSPLRRLTFFKRQKSKQKRCAPPSWSRFALLPSLHHCSEGPPRMAIPGPSRLSRHPCRSTLYTTIPFGLLKGRLAVSDRSCSVSLYPSLLLNTLRSNYVGLLTVALGADVELGVNKK